MEKGGGMVVVGSEGVEEEMLDTWIRMTCNELQGEWEWLKEEEETETEEV